jgi:hypothetical protein
MAYFVGMLANTLPVPGGIGAVDGGMIGALIGSTSTLVWRSPPSSPIACSCFGFRSAQVLLPTCSYSGRNLL